MATKALTGKGEHKRNTIKNTMELNRTWLFHYETNFDKISTVRAGITKENLLLFKKFINIDFDHLSHVLGTTKTTLHKKHAQETFSSSISEKFIALTDVYKFGYEVFEDEENFNKWMLTSNKALGDRVPLDLMDTIFGIDEVKNVIGRIEHGVYS
jgi:putative toxin-antitoxin system antitoxin component (TIGR02293 family)